MLQIYVYIDDLVVIRNDLFKKYMDIIEVVLNLITNSGMHPNEVKCKWAWYSVSYLQFIVHKCTIKPQPLKVKDIYRNWDSKEKHQLRNFFGIFIL